MISKPELRRQLLQQRRSLSPEDWQNRSHTLCQHLLNWPIFQQANTILTYCSHHQEPDLSPLFTPPGKIWGIPRCVGKTLVWHQWEPQTQPLHPGTYGILEPPIANPTLTTADLILVPCVGCDRQGYRLGYGGGFYDRLFADPNWQQTVTIGITFAFAQVAELPIEPWDRKLQWLCTEIGLQVCQR
jgi:5-formyltetrahydrofolate cyclo-ligase